MALGSNLGNRESIIRQAYDKIEDSCGRIVSESNLYETLPVGFYSENLFLNTAILIETQLSPLELLAATRTIESELGREKKSAGTYESRTLDIDIILYGQLLYQSTELTIPHPRFRERRFVLEPLNEIAPNFTDPLTGLSITKLLYYLTTQENI